MNKEITTVDDATELLEEYSSLEGTELGEYWRQLIDFERYGPFCSDEFMEVWQRELLEEANRVLVEFKIIETEKEVVSKKKIKELIYIGD